MTDVLEDKDHDLRVYHIPEGILDNSFNKGWKVNFGEVSGRRDFRPCPKPMSLQLR